MMARVPSSGPIDDKVGPEHDRVAQTAEQTPLKRSVVGSRPIAIPGNHVAQLAEWWTHKMRGSNPAMVFLILGAQGMGLLLLVNLSPSQLDLGDLHVSLA